MNDCTTVINKDIARANLMLSNTCIWNYVQRNPRKNGTLKGEVAYVLPKDCGFGFRNPNYTTWGLWKADESSKKIWSDVNNLLDRYGSCLDIVYSDPEFNNAIKSRYNRLIFWNETPT